MGTGRRSEIKPQPVRTLKQQQPNDQGSDDCDNRPDNFFFRHAYQLDAPVETHATQESLLLDRPCIYYSINRFHCRRESVR